MATQIPGLTRRLESMRRAQARTLINSYEAKPKEEEPPKSVWRSIFAHPVIIGLVAGLVGLGSGLIINVVNNNRVVEQYWREQRLVSYHRFIDTIDNAQVVEDKSFDLLIDPRTTSERRLVEQDKLVSLVRDLMSSNNEVQAVGGPAAVGAARTVFNANINTIIFLEAFPSSKQLTPSVRGRAQDLMAIHRKASEPSQFISAIRIELGVK